LLDSVPKYALFPPNSPENAIYTIVL
jgi:hypothetical protein